MDVLNIWHRNRLDLIASLPDLIDALVSEKVAGPALAHIFVAYRDDEGLPQVISYVFGCYKLCKY